MEQSFNYEQAFTELSAIARDIDSELVSVDILADKVKRASELITYCQIKLRTTEVEVNKIIHQKENQVNDIKA